jgi:hypothetical protein
LEIEMAASLLIEEESGVYRSSLHQHNGYYAGDFSKRFPEELGAQIMALPSVRAAVRFTLAA